MLRIFYMYNVIDDITYRVEIKPDTKYVEVQCFGMNSVDTEAEGTYMSVMELPEWIKDKLAVLNVLPSPPPKQYVEDVGAKINENIFWVVKDS